MSIEIKKVSSKKELKKFIRFNYELYKDNPYSVPDLYDDMLGTFDKNKNAAFAYCDADFFLAYKEGKLVGRVAALINKKANKIWNEKTVRFGWIDFYDDIEHCSVEHNDNFILFEEVNMECEMNVASLKKKKSSKLKLKK